MDRVQPPVFQDQPAPALEQPGAVARAFEPFAIHRAGCDGVDLHFGAEKARHALDHGALPGLAHGVVASVRVGDSEVFLATEVARHVQHVAAALRFHQGQHFVHQHVVGHQVGVQRGGPGSRVHVDDHVFGTGHAGVVDQVVDAAERGDGGLHRRRERVQLADVDPGQDADAALGARVANVFQLADDSSAHRLQLAFAPRRQHDLGAAERQQARHRATDAGRAAGDQRHLADVQAGQVLGESDRGAARAAGLDDAGRQVQVDLADALLLEQQPRGVAGRERHVFGLGVVVANDLVAPLGEAASAELHVDLALVAPDTNQLFHGRTQQVGPGVGATVAAVGQEHEARFLLQVGALLPVAAELARHRDGATEFFVDEALHVVVAGGAERAVKAVSVMHGHDDRAGDGAAVLVGQCRIHRRRVGAVEHAHIDAVAVAHVAQPLTGAGAVVLTRQAHHHAGADLGLQPGNRERVVELVACSQQHGVPDGVDGAHRRAADPGAVALLAHLHAVGDLEVVAVVGRRLVAAQEHAGVGDVGGHREVLGWRLAVEGAVQRHHVEELVRRAAGLGTLELVHRRKHTADALTANRPREDHVHANAALAQFFGHFARQRIQRRFRHHVGRAAVVLGARKDRRHVDDRSAFLQERRGSAQHVPGHAQNVARGLRQRLGVGRPFGAQLRQFIVRERHLLEGLARAGRAGVVDQNVQPPVARHQVGHAGAHAGRVGAVHHHGVGLRRRCAGVRQCRFAGRVEPRTGAARQHHHRAFAQVVADDFTAQVAGRAGDEGHLAREPTGRSFCSAHHGFSQRFGWVGIDAMVQARSPAAQASNSASRLRSPGDGSAWLTT